MADIRARLASPEATNEGTVTNLKQFHVKPSPARPYPAEWSAADLLTLYQLRVEQGLPTQEVADVLGRTDLAVRGKLHRKGWTEPYKRRA